MSRHAQIERRLAGCGWTERVFASALATKTNLHDRLQMVLPIVEKQGMLGSELGGWTRGMTGLA